jgi:arsenate reductase
LSLLEERNVEFDVINYLEKPLDRSTLQGFLDLLSGPPADLVRADPANGIDPTGLSAEQIVDLLLAHPKAMQRPVAVLGHRAVIARPSDLILDLLP